MDAVKWFYLFIRLVLLVSLLDITHEHSRMCLGAPLLGDLVRVDTLIPLLRSAAGSDFEALAVSLKAL